MSVPYHVQSYLIAGTILSFIGGGMVWMLLDLFRSDFVPGYREVAPRRGKRSCLWTALFTICVAGGFSLAIYFFVHEEVVKALLVPLPFFIVARAACTSRTLQRKKPSPAGEITILVLLTAAALIFRTYGIHDYPPGLGEDEIKLALETHQLMEGSSPFSFLTSGPPKWPVCTILALVHHVLERGRIAIRAYQILCGVLCIPAFYCLARLCFPAFIARLATLLMAFSAYHNFFSRVSFGAEWIILAIILLYFTMTGLERSSLPRLAFGAAIAGIMESYYLGFTHIGVMVVILALFTTWAAGRISFPRLLLYSAVAAVLILFFLTPFYYMHLKRPDYFWFTPAKNALPLKTMGKAFSNCFLMFKDTRYGATGFTTMPNIQVLPPPLWSLLLGGLLLAFTLFFAWRSTFIGLCFFIAILPSILSSPNGNARRTMLVIPLMYLLLGYGLSAAAAALKPLGKLAVHLALTAIVLCSSFWSIHYFFYGMWESPGQMEHTWWSSPVRTVEEGRAFEERGYRILTSKPTSAYWCYLTKGASGKNVWRLHEEKAFRPGRWLPENWDTSRRAIILSEQVDGPVFDIMASWSWPYRWEEQFFPVGETRLLIGEMNESGSYRRKALTPKPVLHPGYGTASLEWEGSLMLAGRYKGTLVEQTAGAELHIDGESLRLGETASLYAGLHAVRILCPLTYCGPAGEPSFELELEDTASGTTVLRTLAPSILYAIPVHGWFHIVRPSGNRFAATWAGVEPFIYYGGIFSTRYSRGPYDHLWTARSCPGEGTTLSLTVWWHDGDARVYVDGEEVPRYNNAKRISFKLNGAADGQDVTICWENAGGFLYFKLLDEKGNCPPYDAFTPLIDGDMGERETVNSHLEVGPP